jgi:hypothetical protein
MGMSFFLSLSHCLIFITANLKNHRSIHEVPTVNTVQELVRIFDERVVYIKGHQLQGKLHSLIFSTAIIVR